MAVAEALEEWLDDLNAIGGAANELRDILDGLGGTSNDLSEIFGRMRSPMRAASRAVADVAPAAKDTSGSLDEVAEAMKLLEERAHKLDVLKQAKANLDALKPPVNEVAEAVQKLQAQAHKLDVLKQAKAQLGILEEKTKPAAAAMSSLAGSATNLVEGLTPTSGALGAVSGALRAMGPVGLAAAAAIGVLVAVVGGAAVALHGLLVEAIAISQEKDALAETFAAVIDGAESGMDAVNELSDVAGKLPFAEDKVLGWAKSMGAAGKSGEELVQSLNAIAASAAIMQDNGAAAEAFSKRLQTAADAGEKIKLDRRMQRMLSETGVRATELAKALGVPADKLSSMAIDAGKLGDAFEKALIVKGAGALEKMSLTWGSITGKLRDAWGDLFEDLGPLVQPLMREIQSFFAEFSAGTTLQSAAKSGLTSFFATVFSWATRTTRTLHIVFLEIQIGALKAYIFLAPVVRIMRAIATNAEFLRGIKAIFIGIAGAIGLVVAILAINVASFVAFWAAVAFVLGAMVGRFFYVIGVITGFVSALISGGKEGALGFVRGLVEGIRGGASMVAEAVKELASGAVGAFTSFFQIRSPSRLMKAHGRQLPAGAADGVDEGAIQLEKSMDGVWEMPKKKGVGREGGGRGKLADTVTIIFQGRAEEFDDFRAQMEAWLDQQEAAGPEAEPA